MVDFATLQLEFFSSSAKTSTYAAHTIYCKKHTVRCDDPVTPSNHTLFSVGWPPYCSSEHVESIFSRVGCVTGAYLQHSTGPVDIENTLWREMKGGKIAYVVFSQPGELECALEMCGSNEVVRCDVIGSIGITRWCEDYVRSRPTLAHLDTTVRDIVGQYDETTRKQQIKNKKLSQADIDGWVTVVRRNPLVGGHRKKKKTKKLINFYQFQHRERQREAIAELRTKFQKDKERIAEMRARRKFKPF